MLGEEPLPGGGRVPRGQRNLQRVIVVKSPDPKIFEQAIFIIREDFAGQSGVSEKDVLREARAAANSYLGGGKRTNGKLFARLRAPLYAAAGAIAGVIAWFALHLGASRKSEPVAFDRLRFFRLRDARWDDKINA